MKLFVFILLATLTATVSSFGQTLIAAQNGGSPRFFTTVQDALNNALDKDTIYIPGGAFSFSNNKITIDKELHLIGAGHFTDSTAIGITVLNATIYFITGANNSTVEGLYLNGSFTSGTSSTNEDVDNITISRCSCSSLSLSRLSTNWTIKENVIRGTLIGYATMAIPYAQDNFISNNIIASGPKNFGPNNNFLNNIFLDNSTPTITVIDGSVFRNNVFLTGNFSVLTSCIFENNLFLWTGSSCPSSICNDNINNQTAATTFVNQTGNIFNYTHDYHLKADSPGKNAGKDGTDIGIYGGAFPWKEGSVPSNPHFKSVQISHKTENSGNLNVKISVAAQER